MKENAKAGSVEQIRLTNKPCIRLTLTNVLTHKEAQEMSNLWKSMVGANDSKKFVIIFNAQTLRDYEPMARIVFQKTIGELKNSIEKIWIVTDSKVVAGGGAILGMFSALSITTVDSEDKIIV